MSVSVSLKLWTLTTITWKKCLLARGCGMIVCSRLLFFSNALKHQHEMYWTRAREAFLFLISVGCVLRTLCLNSYRMAAPQTGHSPLVHSLATLLRNNGMCQCDTVPFTYNIRPKTAAWHRIMRRFTHVDRFRAIQVRSVRKLNSVTAFIPPEKKNLIAL